MTTTITKVSANALGPGDRFGRTKNADKAVTLDHVTDVAERTRRLVLVGGATLRPRHTTTFFRFGRPAGSGKGSEVRHQAAIKAQETRKRNLAARAA